MVDSEKNDDEMNENGEGSSEELVPEAFEPDLEQPEEFEAADLEAGIDTEEHQIVTPELESLLARKLAMEEDLDNPIALVERVYQIWWNWADFHLYIISPSIDLINPPVVIMPDVLPNTSEHEFVYPIHDFGSKLSASKSQDMFSAGMSMCKMYYTIEKMISILIERLKSGGIDTETEVQVAFGGHQLPQRKAFESIINLSYNVVVTNFDPGLWGERYLQTVKRIADKGYGYPPEAPRDIFRHSHQHAPTAKQ